MADKPPGLKDFWEHFGDYSNFTEETCDHTRSLAVDVLDHYGIDYDGGVGGGLANIDIKHMDAREVIKLSMLEASSNVFNDYYEAMMDPDGVVRFKKIGGFDGKVIDQYYTIVTARYLEECIGVMVTGGKPLPIRKTVNWKPIWGNLEPIERIYDTSDMVTTCNLDEFSGHATIVYNDPHLTNAKSGYEDGIDNLFEQGGSGDDESVLGPWDSVLGYVRWNNPPKEFITKDTVITHVTAAKIPIRIGETGGDHPAGGAYIGKKLAVAPRFSSNYIDSACWSQDLQGQELQWTDGVEVKIPDQWRFETSRGVIIDKFTGIGGVFLLGKELATLKTGPATLKAAVTPVAGLKAADMITYATINNPSTIILPLSEGKQYGVAYKEGSGQFKIPYIVFVDNGEYDDPMTYGNGPDGEGVLLNFGTNSKYYDGTDEKTISGRHTVLPLSETTGFLVEEIWAVLDINTPSITIQDPNGGGASQEFGAIPERALKIAGDYDSQIAPIVITEEPTPIGYNGREVDQVKGIKNNDPTISQNFEDTDYQKIIDEMQGGSGLSLHLSFLNKAQVKELSGTLFAYMNNKDGRETVYTCGPNCVPLLGGWGPGGGVINQIDYSYTDSQSYTISVKEGPRLEGKLATIGTGPTFKNAGSVSRSGTVIQDKGNHIHYIVRLDDFGEKVAINCCEQIIRAGDRVGCTVHNAPMEA
jgi:hypothetical protein